MKGRRRCFVSVALVLAWLRSGADAVEALEVVPDDIELVEVEFDGDLRRRDCVALVFASSEWPEGDVVQWEPRFRRKGA